jgi:ribosomal protein S18 acetylase RimI-like enzyme
VVESAGEIIGMLVAFPMHVDPLEIESDPVLAPYNELKEDDSYYILDMAIVAEHRGRDIGKQLLALAEQQARDKGLRKISLMVFEQNSGAKRWYERSGYKELRRVAVYPHPLIHFGGDAILMVRSLDTV